MRKILYLLPILAFCACTGGEKSPSAAEGDQQTVVIPDSIELPSHAVALPEVPDTIERPSQKVDYVMLHFWDNIDFADAKALSDTLLIEQTFADYIEILPHSSSVDAAKAAIKQLFARASVNAAAYQLMADVADKYLYTYDSPMRNRSLYRYFLLEIEGNSNLTADQQRRCQQQLSENQQSAD